MVRRGRGTGSLSVAAAMGEGRGDTFEGVSTDRLKLELLEEIHMK